ncbi:hypothetical protein RchiOBHm_Chr6g0284291 [Rosa chinensis]|uniref:Uncharacterized protein n=1 Tax=Rosa chinensis TaxID=74649 RepID=A0A2P6PUD0_ROSCH|nr:hypothetical protein RchiOBHm_Chr6g0284291 [Rosa chinensis]
MNCHQTLDIDISLSLSHLPLLDPISLCSITERIPSHQASLDLPLLDLPLTEPIQSPPHLAHPIRSPSNHRTHRVAAASRSPSNHRTHQSPHLDLGLTCISSGFRK